MAQTSYSTLPDLGFAGLLGDSGEGMFLVSRALEPATAVAFGLGMIYGTDPEKQFDIFSGAGTLAGVLAHKQNRADPSLGAALGIEQDEVASLMRNGRMWVTVEEAITVGDPVYVRHTTGTGTVIGAFRNDADGTAQVTTATPTAVNDTVYRLSIQYGSDVYSFEVLGDASATATEICDDFRTAMAADAAFTAQIVATGTATLILTGQDEGQAFTVYDAGPGDWASITTGTPAASTFQVVSEASWLQGSTAAGIALLQLNLP